ncbi:hypothetical protein NPIL_105051 [Nephila pilipes]|uniref:Uncharacterized protein n=1 Tax=Nephila pilipes TaxID=299642 RepID=A0A8X6N5K6_NEPPI|nr:hypothetical protein NPIL_105051 [Nephila pilipes]
MKRLLKKKTADHSDMTPSQARSLVLVLLVIVTHILFILVRNSSRLKISAVLDPRALSPQGHTLILRGQLNSNRIKKILDHMGVVSLAGSSVGIHQGISTLEMTVHVDFYSESWRQPCSREPQLSEYSISFCSAC